MKLQDFLNDLCFQLYVSQKQCLCGEILNNCINELIIHKKPVLGHYSHPEGWLVEGFERRRWLFITCLKCHLSWSLDKLGVPQSTTQPIDSR